MQLSLPILTRPLGRNRRTFHSEKPARICAAPSRRGKNPQPSFTDVRVLNGSAVFNGVTISKTGGVHGTEAMYANPQLAEILGDAMGVVFQSSGHKTAYIMGDTVWTADVNKALNRYKPDYLIMNTGYALISGISDGIIMGTADVLKASQVMPKAKIITVHMDTVNHTAVSRADMRKFIRGQGIESRVNVPEDGEILKLD